MFGSKWKHETRSFSDKLFKKLYYLEETLPALRTRSIIRQHKIDHIIPGFLTGQLQCNIFNHRLNRSPQHRICGYMFIIHCELLSSKLQRSVLTQQSQLNYLSKSNKTRLKHIFKIPFYSIFYFLPFSKLKCHYVISPPPPPPPNRSCLPHCSPLCPRQHSCWLLLTSRNYKCIHHAWCKPVKGEPAFVPSILRSQQQLH